MSRAVNLPRRAALPGATIPAGADGGLDAELIRLCAEHVANMDACNRLDSPPDGPLWDACHRTFDAIATAKPRTMAGILAKARATKAEFMGEDETCWSWHIVNDLLRRHGGAA